MQEKSSHFSQSSLNYKNYRGFPLLCIIMKHCQRAKRGVPTMGLVEHVERSNFHRFCLKLQRTCYSGDTVKIWCNSSLCILKGRKGKPTDGEIHSGGVNSIL